MLESEEVTYPGVTAVDVSKIMYIAGATSWTSSTITYERWPLEGPRSYDIVDVTLLASKKSSA